MTNVRTVIRRGVSRGGADPFVALPVRLAAALCVALLATACAPTASPSAAQGAPGTARAQFSPACASADQPVTITDPALARAVLSALAFQPADRAEVPCAAMAQLSEVSTTGVESLAGLEYAINLNRLTVRQSPVPTLEPLAGLQRLASVVVQGGRLTSIEAVATLPALSVLDIRGSDVADLTPLAQRTGLTYLVAPDNDISDLAPLAGLTDLFWLELSGNHITDVTPLAGLQRLSTLKLDGNQIADAGSLAGLGRLQRLELQGNLLTDVDFVESLDLQVFSVADNRVTSVSGLARNRMLSAAEPYDLRNNCIDLASDDPFVQDLLERATGLLLEPQDMECVGS